MRAGPPRRRRATRRPRDLFRWAQDLRDDDGAYWTGIVYPELKHFPGGERSTYTAAAVVLAADALSRDDARPRACSSTTASCPSSSPD